MRQHISRGSILFSYAEDHGMNARDERGRIVAQRGGLLRRNFALLGVLAIFLSGCGRGEMRKETRLLMGTYVEVQSYDGRAPKIAFNEIERLENLLSKYRPGSEISRLNAEGGGKVSRETYDLLSRCAEFSRLSSGAFDITVEPLARVWGFKDRDFRVPDAVSITEILPSVGSEKIIFHPADNMIEFSGKGMGIDLGGAGKGYALDRAAEKIKQAGINDFLINAGGQVRCMGKGPGGEPWRIAIKNPRDAGTVKSLTIKGGSLSTSGDYEQFFFDAGNEKKRYSHIIDPRSGCPADSGVASVTVYSPDGFTADLLSTAICVLGKEKGEALMRYFPACRIVDLECIPKQE
ncbi:MAG: FAD:protein FMN transferase [Candidatus Omnitrophota bacterium]|jgi:thiamine biosynthesis lipoprotein